ncbi:MAG: Omp28-related outer membrane protein [Bacteroidales bacterium]
MKKICFTILSGFFISCAWAQTPSIVSTEPSNRNALLEEFTGINCGNCPDGHLIANQIKAANPNNFFVINIHQGDYAVDPSFDLTTNYGNALGQQSGLTGYPSGTINRHIFEGTATVMYRDKWKNSVSKILTMPSYVNVGAKAKIDWATRELTVDVELYYTGNAPTASNYINVALLQNNILGPQAGSSYNPEQVVNGQYNHMHALRDLITGQWGDTVTTVSQGNFIHRTYTKILPEKVKNFPLNLLDIEVVVFVCQTHQEVMTAEKANLTYENGPKYVFEIKNINQVNTPTCDENIGVKFDVFNRLSSANDTIKNVTFACKTTAGVHEFTWEAQNFTMGNTKTVISDAFPILPNDRKEKCVISVSKVNGQAYEYTPAKESSASVVKFFGRTVADGGLIVNIWQDRWGSEDTWTLSKDANSIFKGGPYKDLNTIGTKLNTTTVKFSQTGCINFKIVDASKDGINSSFGQGHLNITNLKGDILTKSDGKFGEEETHYILINGVGNENLQNSNALQAKLYPNPTSASQSSTLSFFLPKTQKVSICIYNLTGSRILDLGEQVRNEGEHKVDLPISNLSKGSYVIYIKGENIQTIQKLIIGQ